MNIKDFYAPLSSDRLEREAEELEREAERMKGASWSGDLPPSLALQRQAQEKRMLAVLLRKEGK